MHKILSIFILSFFVANEDYTNKISGVVYSENETLPGCVVKVLQTNDSTMTNIDGWFELNMPTEGKTFTIQFSSFQGIYSTTEVTNIPVIESSITLDTIPLFVNKFIEPTEYENLSAIEQKQYLPSHCWGQLLGYYNGQLIDTSQLSILEQEHGLTAEEWNYSPKTNTLTIPYSMRKK